MCIKINRWYCCPVLERTQGKPDPEVVNSYLSITHSSPRAWQNGEDIMDEEIESLQLPQYPGFTYVRHLVVSWIRCNTWHINACFEDDMPIKNRYLSFSRACSNCDGYDKCLSTRNDAYIVEEHLEPEHLPHSIKDAGMRNLAAKALERVLRTEASRYQLLYVDFAISELFPLRWDTLDPPILRELVPIVYSSFCIDDPRHNGYPDYGWLLCDCANVERPETYNHLRALYNNSAKRAMEEMPNYGERYKDLYFSKFYRYHFCSLGMGSLELEWHSSSTETPDAYHRKKDMAYDGIVGCWQQLEEKAHDLIDLEIIGGRSYDIQDESPVAALGRRCYHALHVAELIAHDAGLPDEVFPHVCDLLRQMLLPWGLGATDMPLLEQSAAHDDDLTAIKAFVTGIDCMDLSRDMDTISEAYDREVELTTELLRLKDEAVANLDHVHKAFTENAWSHVTSNAIDPKSRVLCPYCSEPLIQNEDMPDAWAPIKMPCCRHYAHLGCLQKSFCKQPERNKTPKCDMCRTEMATWFDWPTIQNGIVLSRKQPGYQMPDGFIPAHQLQLRELTVEWEDIIALAGNAQGAVVAQRADAQGADAQAGDVQAGGAQDVDDQGDGDDDGDEDGDVEMEDNQDEGDAMDVEVPAPAVEIVLHVPPPPAPSSPGDDDPDDPKFDSYKEI